MDGALFKPIAGMFALTGIVVSRMLYQRIVGIRSKAVSLQLYVATDTSKLPVEQIVVSRLFSNLCETPPLFYTVCLFITVLNKVDSTFVTMANTYLALRVIHAGVFLFNNRPRYRAIPFALSLITIGAMTGRLYSMLA